MYAALAPLTPGRQIFVSRCGDLGNKERRSYVAEMYYKVATKRQIAMVTPGAAPWTNVPQFLTGLLNSTK